MPSNALHPTVISAARLTSICQTKGTLNLFERNRLAVAPGARLSRIQALEIVDLLKDRFARQTGLATPRFGRQCGQSGFNVLGQTDRAHDGFDL